MFGYYFPGSLSHGLEYILITQSCRFGTVKSVNLVKDDTNPISTSDACEVNDDMGAWQNLGYDETNAKTETLQEAVDYDVTEGNRIDDDKPADDLMKGEPCQPGQSDVDMGLVDLAPKSVSDSQELPQQCYSKDELNCNDDKATDNIQMKGISVENKLTAGEELNLEEVSGELEEGFVDGSVSLELDAIEKGDGKEHDCNIGHIFEPGCVFVEFGRTEASCMAAHCLHGRSFDDRVVIVGYVPLDIFQDRFPK